MDQVEILKILKPQGIKGELKCSILTNRTEIFANLKKVFISNKEYEIESLSIRFGFAYLKLKAIPDRNEAEKFKNIKVLIDRNAFNLEQGTHFITDLIGKRVIDESGKFIGILQEVEKYGGADVFVITNNNREVSVPYIKSVFLSEGEEIVVNRKAFEENKVWN